MGWAFFAGASYWLFLFLIYKVVDTLTFIVSDSYFSTVVSDSYLVILLAGWIWLL